MRESEKPLSISYIANARIPTEKAHGYQILQMCQAFQENGISVNLLIPNRQNPLEKEFKNTKNYYGLRADIKIEKVFSIDLISTFPTKLQWLTNIFHTFTFALGLFFKIRSSSPESCYYLRDINLASFLFLLCPGSHFKNVFVEVHSLSASPLRKRRQINILRKASGVVAVTKSMANELCQLGLDSKKVLVAHDAVDLKSFSTAKTIEESRLESLLPAEQLIASFIGNFHTNGEEKGIPQIIESAQYLKDIQNLYFYFIGGPLDRVAHYQSLIKKWNLPPERFIFMGKQPITKVPAFLKSSHLLLMPHPYSEFYAHYVSPLKLFEYMSSGRPIIGSKLPAIEEILTHEKNALLGVAGDAKALAENIRLISTNLKLGEKLAAQALADVQAYTWDKRARNILGFMKEQY